MNDINCAISVTLMTVTVKIIIEKSVMCVVKGLIT